jgi:hypothetical protein
MQCATVDTNSLLYIYLDKVDVFDLLKKEGFNKFILPAKIVEELKKLKKKLKGKEKIAASFALELVADQCKIVDIKAEDADTALLLVAEKFGCLLVTSDKILLKRAKNRGVETAYIRERSKLEFSSGYS